MSRKVEPYHNLNSSVSVAATTTIYMDHDARDIFPPTPVGLLDIISASPNPNPNHLMDLWEDFDRFILSTPAAAVVVGGGGGVGISTDMDIDGPLMPIESAADSRKRRRQLLEEIDNDDDNDMFARATAAAVYGIHDDLNEEQDQDQGDGNDNGLRKRGKYRCRKCGEEKRAHDCPFACKQRSISTQTNLEITSVGTAMMMGITPMYQGFFYFPYQGSQMRRPDCC